MGFASDGGDFGTLMRDLRRLVGCEALLAVTHDFDTLEYVLLLAQTSAQSVVVTAEAALLRVQDMKGGL